MRWIIVLAVTGACRFAPSTAHNSDGGPPDTAVDGQPRDAERIGSEPGPICFGSSTIDMVCSFPISNTPLVFNTNITIDTDTFSGCTDATADAIPVCVIQASSITIANNVTVNAHGSKPLVMIVTAAAGTITVTGPNAVLDVGSHLGDTAGPGSLSGAGCQVGATAASGKGGGAGGSSAGQGGDGGDDGGGAGHGVPGAALALTTLHGGCEGDTGSGATLSSLAAGGGAVALIAPTIHIDGTVTASGAGGAGAPTNGGGGGGGAGGMILLDAATIIGTGSIVAQGGGGGEGSGGNGGNDGFDGFDAMHQLMEALGGAGGSGNGGDGGDGASNAQTAGATGDVGVGAAASGGGGGGGGPGANLVLVGTPSVMLGFSPPHQ